MSLMHGLMYFCSRKKHGKQNLMNDSIVLLQSIMFYKSQFDVLNC